MGITMNKRFLTILLPALALFLAACGGSSRPSAESAEGDRLEAIRGAGTIRIGVKVDSAPFGYLVGDTNVGFDVDIATAVASRLDVDEVEFVPVTSATRIPKVVSGEVDMAIASMTITRTRDRIIDFSVPYFQDGQGLLVREDNEIASYLDLDGALVGAVKGSTSAKNIAQVAPGATVLRFADFNQLQSALESGTIDAATSDTMILIGMQGRSKDQLRLAGEAFTVEPYGIAVRENQSNLRDAISNAVQELWESGEYQLIYDTWFGAGTRYEDAVRFRMTPYPR